jgi:hypothetical protein
MSRGIDPEETYPVKNITLHGPEHKTILVPIYPDVEHLTNRQCYGEELAALTKYSLGRPYERLTNLQNLYFLKSEANWEDFPLCLS